MSVKVPSLTPSADSGHRPYCSRLARRRRDVVEASDTPCFTPGTLIATSRGLRPVETLEPGDRVLTRDNGIQEILWLGAKRLDAVDLAARPALRPIRVAAGALGRGAPDRDMLLSPNHRLLITGDRALAVGGESEVLVAARHLVDGAGIAEVEAPGVTYHHFLFDRHEIVLSDGAWTESFQPAENALAGIDRAQRDEILALFPELATPAGADSFLAARPVLSRAEAQTLLH